MLTHRYRTILGDIPADCAYSDENRHPFQSNVGHYFQRKPCHLFRLNHSQSFHSKVGH
jgi:hypothetical protein